MKAAHDVLAFTEPGYRPPSHTHVARIVRRSCQDGVATLIKTLDGVDCVALTGRPLTRGRVARRSRTQQRPATSSTLSGKCTAVFLKHLTFLDHTPVSGWLRNSNAPWRSFNCLLQKCADSFMIKRLTLNLQVSQPSCLSSHCEASICLNNISTVLKSADQT